VAIPRIKTDSAKLGPRINQDRQAKLGQIRPN
jgi:hypothetical protein